MNNITKTLDDYRGFSDFTDALIQHRGTGSKPYNTQEGRNKVEEVVRQSIENISQLSKGYKLSFYNGVAEQDESYSWTRSIRGLGGYTNKNADALDNLHALSLVIKEIAEGAFEFHVKEKLPDVTESLANLQTLYRGQPEKEALMKAIIKNFEGSIENLGRVGEKYEENNKIASEYFINRIQGFLTGFNDKISEFSQLQEMHNELEVSFLGSEFDALTNGISKEAKLKEFTDTLTEMKKLGVKEFNYLILDIVSLLDSSENNEKIEKLNQFFDTIVAEGKKRNKAAVKKNNIVKIIQDNKESFPLYNAFYQLRALEEEKLQAEKKKLEEIAKKQEEAITFLKNGALLALSGATAMYFAKDTGVEGVANILGQKALNAGINHVAAGACAFTGEAVEAPQGFSGTIEILDENFRAVATAKNPMKALEGTYKTYNQAQIEAKKGQANVVEFVDGAIGGANLAYTGATHVVNGATYYVMQGANGATYYALQAATRALGERPAQLALEGTEEKQELPEIIEEDVDNILNQGSVVDSEIMNA